MTLPPTNARYVYTPHYYTLVKFIIPIYTHSKNKPGQKHHNAYGHIYIYIFAQT